MRPVFTIMFHFLFALLLVGVSHSAACQTSAVGRWNVSDIQRHMSGKKNRCDWRFKISQFEAQGPVTDCAFTVKDTQGQACDAVQFSEQCLGQSGFEVNGGHSGLGFMVLVLYNSREDAKAYFGASDDALNSHADIPYQIILAYPASTMNKRWLGTGPRDKRVLATNTRSWMVQNFTRSKSGCNCTWSLTDIASSSASLSFTIQDNTTLLQVSCDIIIETNNVDLETLIWPYRRCSGSEYSVHGAIYQSMMLGL